MDDRRYSSLPNCEEELLVRNKMFYNSRLSRYFDSHYQEYTETAEWYTNPAINQWKFEIPGISVVVLTCSSDGDVTETITTSKNNGNETP